MGDTVSYKYIAFISYKREDEKWAKWLQHKLEHYHLPVTVRKERPDLPESVRPVFRDTTDLGGGALAEAIRNGLEASKYLIVVCSPRAAGSPWVGKEVKEFISLGRKDRIIPFIVEGTPHSQDPAQECFPDNLNALEGEDEPIGINVKEGGRDAAAVKVVATMFGLRFDSLWQRYLREEKTKKKRTRLGALALAVVLLGISALGIRSSHKAASSEQAYWDQLAQMAWVMIGNGDAYGARRMILDSPLLPDYPMPGKVKTILDSAINIGTIHLPGHEFIAAATLSDTTLITLDTAKLIRTWDITIGECIDSVMWDFPGKLRWKSPFFSPDGKVLTDGYRDVYDSRTGKLCLTLQDRRDFSSSSGFSPDGKFLLGDTERGVGLWSASSGELLSHWSVSEGKTSDYYGSSSAGGAVMSHDGRMIAAGYDNGIVSIWSSDTGVLLMEMDDNLESDDPRYVTGRCCADKICFSPDGQYLVFTTPGGDIFTLSLKYGFKGDVEQYYYGILSLHFSPDSETFLITDGRGRIREMMTAPYLRSEYSKEWAFEKMPVQAFYTPDGSRRIFVLEDEIHIMKATSNRH